MLHLLLYLAAISQLTGSMAEGNALCTVTGPTVIDFGGNVNSVQDRCAYTLFSTAELKVFAVFRERRRQNVSFLDHVILRLEQPAVDIHLGQGGKVQVNDSTLSLSAPQTVHGVKLSQDESGVTANASFSSYNVAVLFDGTSAQIHGTGSAPVLQGLCGNSTVLGEAKFSEFSSSSCDTASSEAADSRINCTRITERCNLLKEAPFTSCHSLVNPQSHATACTDTLCRYPDVDGLYCQFLEVYAAGCGLMGGAGVEDWRSQSGCSPPPQDICRNASCSEHEFCGDDIGGRRVCLCRAIFAAGYKSRDSLGDLAVCEQDSASVSLPACLLTERGIDHTTLGLNDHTCGCQVDEKTHMVTFGFQSNKSCGAVILVSNETITYKNTIKTNSTSNSALISRQGAVGIDFSCFYRQPDVKAMSFKIKGGKAMQQIMSGSWNYNVTTGICADIACTKPFDFSDGIQTDQIIYMSLNTGGLDGDIITLVMEACTATDTEGGGGLKYDLVKNGCGDPNDSTVKVVDDGKGGTILAFQMFQFKGNNNGIFLSCKMKLCLKSDPGCQPNCQKGRRRRRSVRPQYEDQNPVFVSMSWT